jgi:hypothetical protein
LWRLLDDFHDRQESVTDPERGVGLSAPSDGRDQTQSQTVVASRLIKVIQEDRTSHTVKAVIGVDL